MPTFSGTGCLTSTTTRGRPAIDVEFQVLMSTMLGLIVQFLKVLRGPLESRVGAIPNQGRRNRVSIFHMNVSVVADAIWGIHPSSRR